jgi:uncharacterized protein YbjT (DUF2867 family)
MPKNGLVLVTGATGYVGGRLVPRLLDAGWRVRCLVRDADRLSGRAWSGRVEIVTGDALDPASLKPALQGVSAAYYLMHGLQGGLVNAGRDVQMAVDFSEAAAPAGVERIIYLGELVDPGAALSPYLRSRLETGLALGRGRVPVIEFRSGMLVGSGSLLFEMIRYLAERQPLLICPAWFFALAQPIAVRDALSYLIAALEMPAGTRAVVEIGGPTRLSYADILLSYARERGLERRLIRLPVYVPRLSAYWVHMLTPIHWRAILPLIQGLRSGQLVHEDTAGRLFPHIHPIDFQAAVHLALGRIQRDNVETSWSDALVNSMGAVRPYSFSVEEGMMFERRALLLDLPGDTVYRSYAGIGGERGWLYMDWAWALRGWMDKAIGGVGLRRGRRHPDEIRTGESLDFWRVEQADRDHLLRLRAEMKIPGRAWLQFESVPQSDGRTLLVETAYFAPRGFWGFIYWYAMWPFHAFLFNGLIRRLASRAVILSRSSARPRAHAAAERQGSRRSG